MASGVGEFIVLDPDVDELPSVYLRGFDARGPAVAPVRFDVAHQPSVELAPFRLERPVTGQQHYWDNAGPYSKLYALRSAPFAGRDAHSRNGAHWQMVPNIPLYDFHHFNQFVGICLVLKQRAMVPEYEKEARTHRVSSRPTRGLKLAWTTVA
ncbi:hypothetical protein JANAI62_32260 [Jannaschia pagri]|uniref:Dioxygenase n=1 Tax=Jannaschia pagri TaxID=2829797 RepID=A0ABQ4NQF9_9RHOB|nr:hypothetical protein JANAI61_32260 [Jannaschia sp. AI_61]GIT96603.1 hypothetical protein JANAI62_32260 [Jannaschia sp. AI_62]